MHKGRVIRVGIAAVGLAWAVNARAQSGPSLPLVPYPLSVQKGQGSLTLSSRSRIVATDKALMPLAQVLSNDILLTHGVLLAADTGSPRDGNVVLSFDKQLKDQAYTLDVGVQATLTGPTSSSWLDGWRQPAVYQQGTGM